MSSDLDGAVALQYAAASTVDVVAVAVVDGVIASLAVGVATFADADSAVAAAVAVVVAVAVAAVIDKTEILNVLGEVTGPVWKWLASVVGLPLVSPSAVAVVRIAGSPGVMQPAAVVLGAEQRPRQ